MDLVFGDRMGKVCVVCSPPPSLPSKREFLRLSLSLSLSLSVSVADFFGEFVQRRDSENGQQLRLLRLRGIRNLSDANIILSPGALKSREQAYRVCK